MSHTDPLVRLRGYVLRLLHQWGYALWCWTDDRMADDEPRIG